MESATGTPILIACDRCGRQYDVSHLEPGAPLRCACERVLTVVHREPRAALAMRCASCGAAFRDGARACAYCGTELTIEERGMSCVCPNCHGRMAADARFCMGCGTEVAPQSFAAAPVGSPCPRCSGSLRTRALTSASVIECGACGGLWLDPKDFDRICERADQQQLALRQLAERTSPERAADAGEVRYHQCIRCRDRMIRRNFGGSSGIILDVCRDHGVWLDHSEMEKVLGFVRAGGLARAREREVDRLKEEADRAVARRMTPAPVGLSEEPRPARPTSTVDLADVVGWIALAVGRWLLR